MKNIFCLVLPLIFTFTAFGAETMEPNGPATRESFLKGEGTVESLQDSKAATYTLYGHMRQNVAAGWSHFVMLAFDKKTGKNVFRNQIKLVRQGNGKWKSYSLDLENKIYSVDAEVVAAGDRIISIHDSRVDKRGNSIKEDATVTGENFEFQSETTDPSGKKIAKMKMSFSQTTKDEFEKMAVPAGAGPSGKK